MKMLIRIVFIGLIAMTGIQANAQKFGIQGGINLTTMVDEDDEYDYADIMDYENKLGFNGGITFELGFGDLFALEMAALVNSKGIQISEGDNYIRFNLLYADVPVMLKVGPSFGPIKVFGAVGPYMGYGITGNASIKIDGEKESEDIEWGDGEENDIKRLDYGAKFGIGGEVMGLTLGAYYSLGLANVAPTTEGGYTMKHRVISISLGYKF